MPTVLILLLALSKRNNDGPYFPLFDTKPPTKMDKFFDWLLKVGLGVGIMAAVIALLWVMFLIGFAIYTLIF